MKKIWMFLFLVFAIGFGLIGSPFRVDATYTENVDGSVTITGDDLISKMKITGTTQTAVYEKEIPTYQLTENKPGQLGSIYLEDRLSANQNFKFSGRLHGINPGVVNAPRTMGDGQSLIFHGDDTKFVGLNGGALGVLQLKNASGLVFDVHHNKNYEPSLWQNDADKNDPGDINSFYLQGWSTNAEGKGKRVTTPTIHDKGKYVSYDKKYISIDYNAKTRIMKFTVNVTENINNKPVFVTTVHEIPIPKEQEYFYFASTGSTGEATGEFYTQIESITYTPVRYRTIKYVDIDSKNVLKEEQLELAVNSQYKFTPENIANYNVISIEGELEGQVKYEDELLGNDVTVYLKKNNVPTIQMSEINDKGIERKGDKLNLQGNQYTIVSTTPISKITITAPKELKLANDSSVPSGWTVSEYETNNKKVFEAFNSSFANDGKNQGSLTAISEIQNAITNFGKFEVLSDQLLDNTNLKVELSYYPIVIHENEEETTKTGFYTPYLYDIGFKKMPVYDFVKKLSSPLIPLATSFYSYRGITASMTNSEIDNTSFVKKMLDAQFVAAGDTFLGGNNVTSNSAIEKYFIKYNLDRNGLEGVDEMADVPKTSIPQPVTLVKKDTLGNILGTEELNTSYKFGDVLYADAEAMPKIEDYEFVKLENESFPIKITNQKKEIVAVYVSDKLVWGNVPWSFNESEGLLTLNSKNITNPKLDESPYSPWRRGDDHKINPNKIIRIELEGEMLAPENSAFLFSDNEPSGNGIDVVATGLPNLVAIDGLDNLNVSDVTDFGSMFHQNKKLESLDISKWDVRKGSKFSVMFMNTENIKSLDISEWQIDSATSLYGMFYGMTKLEVLDVKKWNVSKVNNFDSTFGNIQKLEALDLSGWNMQSGSTQKGMFYYTPKLRKLTLGNNTILKETSLSDSPVPNFTGKWQILGANGTLDNPRGNWSGLASELEIRTQKIDSSGDTYVWQPLNGEINISQYPKSYQFITNTIDNMPIEKALEPTNKDTKYIGIKDSRRITSPWTLKVAAKELASTTDEEKKIDTAKINLTMDLVSFNEAGEPIVFPSSLDSPDFSKQLTLITDCNSVSLMSLGDDTNKEPQVGDYGLSISDVSLVLPGNAFQEKDVYQSKIIWTLDSVPIPGLLNVRENTPETTKIE